MLETFLLIAPVFVVIALGWWAKRARFVPDAFWAPAEKLVYFIFLPALIVKALAARPLDLGLLGLMAATVAIVVVTMALLVLALRPALRLPAGSFASVLQSSIRLNGIYGIAMLATLHGDAALPLVAVLTAAWIPLSNGLAVYAYVRAGGGATSPWRTAGAVLTNPMIASVGIGLALALLGAGGELARFPLLDILAAAALPIGLLAVGASLDLDSIRATGRAVLAASVLKLLVMPAVAIGVAHLFALDPLAASALVMFAALPTSPGGYVLASRLGGDARLMASAITLQHAVAVVTLSAVAVYWR